MSENNVQPQPPKPSPLYVDDNDLVDYRSGDLSCPIIFDHSDAIEISPTLEGYTEVVLVDAAKLRSVMEAMNTAYNRDDFSEANKEHAELMVAFIHSLLDHEF